MTGAGRHARPTDGRHAVIYRMLIGDDPKLLRLLAYWAGTFAYYLVGQTLLLIEVHAGDLPATPVYWLGAVQLGALIFFYGLVRVSQILCIKAAQLAFMQAAFAVLSLAVAYVLAGPIRGASLMVLLVTLVFCAFSLRQRQTIILCALSLTALACACCVLVWRDPLVYPARIEAIHFVLATASMIAVAALTGEMGKLHGRLKQQKNELEAALEIIGKLATTDELTALANRRHMNELLHLQERRSDAHGRSLCIAIIDLDFFKRINDRYGHAVGDAVLCSFAATARMELRTGDVLARWGGEEFLLMLPDTELADAERILARLATDTQAMNVPGIGAEHLPVTFSAGVAARGAREPFAETISRADKAMYAAKQAGRNRVIVAQAAQLIPPPLETSV